MPREVPRGERGPCRGDRRGRPDTHPISGPPTEAASLEKQCFIRFLVIDRMYKGR
jgi:hypothetical protein